MSRKTLQPRKFIYREDLEPSRLSVLGGTSQVMGSDDGEICLIEDDREDDDSSEEDYNNLEQDLAIFDKDQADVIRNLANKAMQLE